MTQHGKCFETRGLNRPEHLLIAEKKFENDARDFTPYLNDWSALEALNDVPREAGVPRQFAEHPLT